MIGDILNLLVWAGVAVASMSAIYVTAAENWPFVLRALGIEPRPFDNRPELPPRPVEQPPCGPREPRR